MQYQKLLCLAVALVAAREVAGLNLRGEAAQEATQKSRLMDNRIFAGGKEAEIINVLCIGDSITMGTKVKKSYPDLLFEELNGVSENSTHQYVVENQGQGGATMLKMKPGTQCSSSPRKDIYSYWDSTGFKRALNSHPDIITIALGANDLAIKNFENDCGENWEKRYEEDYIAMVKEMQKISSFHGSVPEIYLLTPTPLPCEEDCGGTHTSMVAEKHGADFVKILQRVQKKTGVKGVIDINALFVEDGEIKPDFKTVDGIHPKTSAHKKMAKAISERIIKDARNRVLGASTGGRGFWSEIWEKKKAQQKAAYMQKKEKAKMEKAKKA